MVGKASAASGKPSSTVQEPFPTVRKASAVTEKRCATVQKASPPTAKAFPTVQKGRRAARLALDGGASASVCFFQEDTMTREEYEERRRAFEEQHRVDVALMNAAQEARIRSLDRLWQEELDRART